MDKWDKENVKTENQWKKLGYVPKDNVKPAYIWMDRNNKPKTIYYHRNDVMPINEMDEKS